MYSAAGVLRTLGALLCRWIRSRHRPLPIRNVPASAMVHTHVTIGHFFRDELVREIEGSDEVLSERHDEVLSERHDEVLSERQDEVLSERHTATRDRAVTLTVRGSDEVLSESHTAPMPHAAIPPEAQPSMPQQTMPHHAVSAAGGMQSGLDGGLGGMGGESRSGGAGGEAWHGQMRKMLLFIDGLALLGLDMTKGHVALEMAALDLYQVVA